MDDASTIAAIATPIGSGGIGIVKISGAQALSIAKKIFVRPLKNYQDPNLWVGLKSHFLNYGYIVDPETYQLIDEVLLTFMKAPYSYTREDVVEINAHSSLLALRSILELVVKMGARLAEPGEFTRRAFMNGRIDLTQAEAVMDIIHARSSKALEIANNHLRGEIHHHIDTIRKTLVDILSELEASIDFPEDMDDTIDLNRLKGRIHANIIQPLRVLLNNYETYHLYRDGLDIMIIGKPNVGKSSLLNRIICRDRAIVTSIPGTTRDIIEESLTIEGIPVRISDTAGLHDSDDIVEKLGIQKVHEAIDRADLILFMLDASLLPDQDDFSIFERIHSKSVILVLNKMDLINESNLWELPCSWNPYPIVKLSALLNYGIDDLKKQIVTLFIQDRFEDNYPLVPNLRHKIGLDRSLQASLQAIQGIENGLPPEIIQFDLHDSLKSMNEILGISAPDEILDQIFNRFCIGK